MPPDPAPAPAPIIHLQGLSYCWPGQVAPCLDRVDLAVAAGEQVFLHGESGSGKSTLLNLAAGVLRADGGSVTVLGQALERLSAAQRDRFRVDHVGLIFQQFNLIPYLSVLDNVLLPARFSARRKQRAEAEGQGVREAAATLLRHLDLAEDLWSRPAVQLSVGQQQRVAAARALLGRPEIVIADEPTSALDAARQTAFLDLLRRECAAASAALLFVSHDQRLAAGFGRQVAMQAINKLPPPPGEGRGEGATRPSPLPLESTLLPHTQPLSQGERGDAP